MSNESKSSMMCFLTKAFYITLLISMIALSFPKTLQASEEKKSDNQVNQEVFIKVPPLTVTMYHRGRPKGNMTITLWVKLVDSDKRATAQIFLPRLSSAYVIEASRLAHDFFDVTRPVNVTMLADSFQIVTNNLLGHKEAKVLMADVIVSRR